ncbi:MAG: condensation domain-containing protein, partial [Bacilli bacterium]|nr:condensation domain-containing protein [Bacilli bacterium]
SWRIIGEDLKKAVSDLKAGRNVQLPKKTASFKEWAEALDSYRQSEDLLDEFSYWKLLNNKLKEGGLKNIRRENEYECIENYDRIHISLSPIMTDKLLKEVGKAFNTQINDILLAALARTIGKMENQQYLGVMLEGHGREQIDIDIDIDRTVGWFTICYPIVLNCELALEDTIIETKEMLRNIPNKGIGYGLLKSRLEDTTVDISFNYLGEIDAEGNNVGALVRGQDISNKNITDSLIDFNLCVSNKQLDISIRYKVDYITKAFAQQLVEQYELTLEEIINHCVNQEKRQNTASDYDITDMSNQEFQLLLEMYGGKF